MNIHSQIDIDDWDMLFHAVEHRLCACVSDVDLIDDKTRATVLECVRAFDQLHSALTCERQQRCSVKDLQAERKSPMHLTHETNADFSARRTLSFSVKAST